MSKFRATIFGLVLLAGWPGVIWAEGQAQKEFSPSIYLFHLYYDNGQLFADRDFQFKYDILVEEYQPEIADLAEAYRGEIVDFKNQVQKIFRFNPRPGKISVKGPFLADGKEINFYNTEDKKLLTISLSDTSFCNDDGICNADVGEDTQTCSSDCPIPRASISLTPTPPIENKSDMKIFLIWGGAGLGAILVAALAAWIIMKRLKKKNELPPPQI